LLRLGETRLVGPACQRWIQQLPQVVGPSAYRANALRSGRYTQRDEAAARARETRKLDGSNRQLLEAFEQTLALLGDDQQRDEKSSSWALQQIPTGRQKQPQQLDTFAFLGGPLTQNSPVYTASNNFVGSLAYDLMSVTVAFSLSPKSNVGISGFVQQVPEPATLAMLTGGLVGFAAFGRRYPRS
jgi:hypothetical protein